MSDFLDKLTKDIEKSGFDIGAAEPPRYWFSTGNHVLNKVISGSFMQGVPQGRLLCYTGPSGSGKSFLAGNAIREAQRQGALCFMLDSENAFDNKFAANLGIDVDKNYRHISIDTIPQTKKIVSKVLMGYKKEYGRDPDAPKVLIVIDSLDMLTTESEQDNFEKGITKGDQGQRSKQIKAMLREFVQNVKHSNISIIVTAQVYKNQDLTNGEGLFVVNEAIRFSLSQIVLLKKLKLKEDKEVSGIRMVVEGFKTRFTKPFQNVTIEVPYDTGMDPYNGLIDVAVDMDIVDQKGAWCYLGDTKWQGKRLPSEHAEAVLAKCEEERQKYLDARIDELLEVDLSEGKSSRQKRKDKHTGEKDG